MRTRITSLFVVALLGLLLVTPVWADTLYVNGLINGTIGGWTINHELLVSDSFTLASNSNLTGAQIGLWMESGDVPTSVDWSIGTTAFASDVGSGTTAILSNSFLSTNGDGYDIYGSNFTFTLNGLVAGTTYWLTIHNASTQNGDYVYWDENDGPSLAQESVLGVIGSESFQILGNSTAVPEPATMLLLGSGLIGLAGYGRKKFFKK